VQASLADCYKAIQLNPADTAAYLCRAQFYLSTGAPYPALEDINRAMLVGQNPKEAVAMLTEARKMVDAREQAPPQQQPAPVAQAPAAQAQVEKAQATPPRPPPVPSPAPAPVAAPVVAPAASAVPAPAAAPVVAPIAPPQLAQSLPSRLPGPSATITSVRPPQLAGTARNVSVAPQVLTPVVNSVVNKEVRGSRDATRLYRQGRDLTEQENFEQAVQTFTQAIQMDPTFALALNARGYARLRLHRYQDAIEDCSQAIRLNPGYGNAYLNRSVAKRALGDITGAREDQRHAAELDRTTQAQASLGKPLARQ
jgi:tetratricopeptide (TPR) repeat protein